MTFPPLDAAATRRHDGYDNYSLVLDREYCAEIAPLAWDPHEKVSGFIGTVLTTWDAILGCGEDGISSKPIPTVLPKPVPSMASEANVDRRFSTVSW